MTPSEISEIVRQNGPWLFSTLLTLLIVTAAVRLVLKLRRGEEIWQPTLDHTRFAESWRSGATWTLLAARHGLWVTLTDDVLLIGLHFPFSLVIPSWFGLQARIKPADVIAVESQPRILTGNLVAIRFRNSEGLPAAIEVNLDRADEFIRLLKEVCRAQGNAI